MTLHLIAPAKLNLALELLSKRSDGYHELVSLMQTIDLTDLVRLDLAPGIELVVTGDRTANLPEDPRRNLAYRAAELMQDELVRDGTQDPTLGVRIELDKGIPAGAGLGGGSSDAAAVIRGLNRLWKLDWHPSHARATGRPPRLGRPVLHHGRRRLRRRHRHHDSPARRRRLDRVHRLRHRSRSRRQDAPHVLALTSSRLDERAVTSHRATDASVDGRLDLCRGLRQPVRTAMSPLLRPRWTSPAHAVAKPACASSPPAPARASSPPSPSRTSIPPSSTRSPVTAASRPSRREAFRAPELPLS